MLKVTQSRHSHAQVQAPACHTDVDFMVLLLYIFGASSHQPPFIHIQLLRARVLSILHSNTWRFVWLVS